MRNKLELLSLDESPPPVSPPSAGPPWTELPPDVTANILQRLGASEILESAQLVCTTWWKVCQDPAMWRVIKIDTLFYYDDELMHCDIACRRAVDRSQGQLVDLHISYFGDDDEELLDYIVNRSSHLRHLTLDSFKEVSRVGVVEAVKKLPELEEFRLISDSTLVPEDIESIATSCPSLNSFALKLNVLDEIPIPHNDYAVAISKFMPSLQHLQLACDMDNIGLDAILDGCPNLESLDLEQCDYIDLGGALGQRCRDQIKHLVIPLHDDDDYDYNAYDDYGHHSDEDYWGI